MIESQRSIASAMVAEREPESITLLGLGLLLSAERRTRPKLRCARLVGRAGHEAQCDQHAQRTGCLTTAEPRPGSTLQLCPVASLGNLSDREVTLLGPCEKDSARWRRMFLVNVHDGSMHNLEMPTLAVLAQTFDMGFAQYVRHPESKSLARTAHPAKATRLDCWDAIR